MNLKKTVTRSFKALMLMLGISICANSQSTVTFDQAFFTQNWVEGGITFNFDGNDDIRQYDPRNGVGHWFARGDINAGYLSAFSNDIKVNGIYLKTGNPGDITNLIIRGYDENNVNIVNSSILNPLTYQFSYQYVPLNFTRVRKIRIEYTNAGMGEVFGDDMDYCALSTIVVDPINTSVCPGTFAQFYVTDYSSISYQWQEDNGGGFTNLSNGGIYSGTNTSAMSISNASLGMHNNKYRVISYGVCSPSDTSAFATLNTSGAMSAVLQGTTDVTCNGANDGTATVFATGPGTFNYVWSPSGGTGDTGTGLMPGTTYTCNIDNGCGGSDIVTATVNEPAPLMVSVFSQTDPSCAFYSDGSAQLIISGGTQTFGYSVQWYNSSLINVASGDFLGGAFADSYSVQIYDDNACFTSTNVTLTDPPAVTPFISAQTNVDCNGNSTGSATVTGAGGAGGPYTYSWLALGTTDTETGLSAGSYSCTVTDMMGCSFVQTVNITQPGPMTYSVLSGPSHNNCFGGANGSMNLMGMGGDWSFTYLWSPGGQTIPNPSDLTAGDHTVTITDGNGCTVISPPFSIFEPAELQANFTVTDVSCTGANDGMITTAASGGTGTIYYNWIPGGTGVTFLSGLGPNSYNLELTDDNGCFVSLFTNVNEPLPISANITATNVTCTGAMNGMLVSVPTGGTAPFIFSWQGGSPNDTLGSLNPGTYSVTVTDVNSCFVVDSGIVTEPTNIISSAGGTDPLCFGGSDGTAVNNPTGGTPPYTYLWTPSGQTTQTATGLSAGNHNVTITDANGCIVGDLSTLNNPPILTATVSVISHAGCAGQANGVADINGTGGTGAYTYVWTSGGTTNIETGLPAGNHTATLTDANGCNTSDVVSIGDIASTDLQGEITATTLNISNGYVLAFKLQPATNGIDTVAITPIIAGTPGSYTFSGLQADDYLIKVLPDVIDYPTSVPTYYGDVFQWDSSTVVTHGCAANDTADINVLEVLSAPAGNGFISGFIIEAQGFQNLRILNIENPNIPFVPGGPLKGVDVKLGKNPGGGIQARTMTDSTGYYNFDSIPDGSYTIYVDIPNLPMDSTRTLSIAGLDSSFQNNYFADSVYVFITDTVITPPVSIHASENIYENKFSIYPNPAKDVLNLQFSITEKACDVSFEISDVAGKVVYSVKEEKYKQGDHTFRLNTSAIDLKAGVYFISIINENRKYTQRIVVVE